jgi:glycosyltransferase involved in cell wall biosynthesis
MNEISAGKLYYKPKILIVSDAWHPQVNGVVRTYEYIAEELEAIDCDVKVIGPADFSFSFPMPGYEEIRLVLAPYRKLCGMIEKYNPDYIHAATEGPLGWATRKYCISQGRSFTTSYHTQFPDYAAKRAAKYLPFLYGYVHKLAKNFVRKFHEPANAMMVATPSLEEYLSKWGFKVSMLRLTRGVNTDIFHPGEKNLFETLKRPVALYAGRVAIEKNLEAFLGMEWEGSKVVVGDGPSSEELKRIYPEAFFAGKKTGSDLADHYRSADVFVFPSKTDTFGIVLIEALACGLPVAAYDVTGPRDIVSEPFLGVLGEDLSAASREALNSGYSQQRFDHVRKHYTWELAARQFLEAFSLSEE